MLGFCRVVRAKRSSRNLRKIRFIFLSWSTVAFAKRKYSCTEVWIFAKTWWSCVQARDSVRNHWRDDLGGWLGGLVGGGARKFAPFENRRDAAHSKPEGPRLGGIEREAHTE